MATLVIEQDPVKRLLGCISYSEAQVLQVVVQSLHGGTNNINQGQIATDAGVSRPHVSSVLHLAQVAGILSSRSLGSSGTVVVIEQDMVDRLLDAFQNG